MRRGRISVLSFVSRDVHIEAFRVRYTHLPIIDRALLRHELVYAEPALTHVLPAHADELAELSVALVDLAGAAPQARGDAHRRENTVVVEQQALEGFFDEDEVLGR